MIINDYGHGGKDPGAVSGNVKEKDYTLDIGKRVNEGLRKQGIKVSETRDKDITLSNTERVNKVKNSKAKYCLSHHINAGGGTGFEVLVSKYNDGKLANLILQELSKLGLKNRGIKKRALKSGQDYYFMHRLTGNITTLIIEYCFIDNKVDRDFLLVEKNRQAMADAVVRAVCKHEGIPYIDKIAANTGNLYKVQVGVFSGKENADKLAKELKAKGYNPFIKIE